MHFARASVAEQQQGFQQPMQDDILNLDNLIAPEMDIAESRVMDDVSTFYEHALEARVPASAPTAESREETSSVPADRKKPSRQPIERCALGSEASETVDRMVNATVARFTFGVSPVAMSMAYYDWLLHLMGSPGKQFELVEKAVRKGMRFTDYAARALVHGDIPPCIEPLPQDRRFRDEAWQQLPYNLIHQSFLLNQQWWHNATTGIRGVSKAHEQTVEFFSRQLLDMWSPSNHPLLNPEILRASYAQGGANFVRGAMNFVEDMGRRMRGDSPAGTEEFEVGKNLAITEGKVVYRNRLMELIQYAPSTEAVWRKPVLMLPAWMMKYYIMDLEPRDSLVKYLVDNGHTVFMVSWKNPGSEDRDLGMEDYRRLGVMAALDAISAIVPGERIHGVGYCLGGMLLTIAAAAMARDGDDRLASMTLFTALTDFTEVGEMAVFMDDSQIMYIEDMMWQQGYLDGKQAAGSFQLLRSRDLIWSKMVKEYFLGEREQIFDLMAWNADTTRMAYRQHSELLRRLYRDNQLFQGEYQVDGRPIAISDIHIPVFAVAASRDHVAPWKSVYKIHLQSDSCELTFVLTSGGHNVGIVNEPGRPGRSYQIATCMEGERFPDADTWQRDVPKHEGSWWPAWQEWLSVRHSSGRVPPPSMGAPEKGLAPLCDAPGTYVYMR
jgi:polyhydroxyalkanoate synthase